jgi:hypothetical protein
MIVVGSRRYPCCGRRFRVSISPGEAITRRCTWCKRRFVVGLAPAHMSDRLGGDAWRVEITEEQKGTPS